MSQCATSPVRRGPAVGGVTATGPAVPGLSGFCGVRARVTLERLTGSGVHPRPATPVRPASPASRADLHGRVGLDGDFGGLQATPQSLRSAQSFQDLFEPPVPPGSRAAAEAAGTAGAAHRALAIGGPRAPGHRGRACPWSGQRVRSAGHGHHKSIAASTVRRRAQVVRSPLSYLVCPGPKRPRFTGGAPAADLSDWG
jgi:hypothetical protein